MEIAGLSSSATGSAWRTDHARDDGQPSGVLIDGAQALVTSKIPPVGRQQLEDQIQLADRELRRVGITTVDDAGADGATVERIQATDRRRHDQDAPVCDAARQSSLN